MVAVLVLEVAITKALIIMLLAEQGGDQQGQGLARQEYLAKALVGAHQLVIILEVVVLALAEPT